MQPRRRQRLVRSGRVCSDRVRSGRVCSGRVRSGFTLMELMLVLAITAIVAAFVIPRLFNVQGREVLRNGANQLSGAMLDARHQAISTGQTTFLMYQANSGLYAIAPEPIDEASSEQFNQVTQLLSQVASSASSPAADGLADYQTGNSGVVEQLPRGVRFLVGQTGEAQENDMQGIQAEISGLPYVAFAPDGTSDDAILELTNEDLDRITVQLRGLTGAVRVGELVPNGVVTTAIAPNGVR